MIVKRTLYLSIIFIIGNVLNGWAQCAMCRAAVENNVSEGSVGLSVGLNTGILYLFFTPYLLVAIIGFLWYKKTKAHAQKIQANSHFGS